MSEKEPDRAPARSGAWRLTAPASGIFAVGTALILLVAYGLVRYQVEHELDAVLTSAAADMASELGSVPPEDLRTWLDEERRDLLRFFSRTRTWEGRSDTPELAVVATDADGSPRAWVGVRDPRPLVNAVRAGGVGSRHARLDPPASGSPFHVAAWSSETAPGLVIAVSEPDTEPVLGTIAIFLSLLWVSIVAIGSSVAWWSVRRALKRVERLTLAAAAIDDPESGRRLEDAGRQDEIGRLATTLNGMLDRIAAAVREMRHVSQDAAHDLRTPLTAIRGKLEMALSRSPERWQDEVVEAVEGLDRLEAMLQAILDIAESEGGALELRPVRVDLASLCREMVDLYAPAAEERGLALRAEAERPVEIQGDLRLLQRALGNLLDNALRHVRGGSLVVASARYGDGVAELAVEDDGEGLPEELASRLFDRSVRGRDSSGLGLGLPLVRAVAQAHGGEARLERGRTGGAKVSLLLPVHMTKP